MRVFDQTQLRILLDWNHLVQRQEMLGQEIPSPHDTLCEILWRILRKSEVSYYVMQLTSNSLSANIWFLYTNTISSDTFMENFLMKKKMNMLTIEIQLFGIWTHINKISIFHFQSAVQQLLIEKNL